MPKKIFFWLKKIKMKKITLLFCLLIPIKILTAQFGEEHALYTESEARKFIVGDINGDGRLDVITNGLNWHSQQVDGQFREESKLGPNVVDLKLADFNNDGALDMVYLHVGPYNYYYDDNLILRLNQGGGAFGQEIIINSFWNFANSKLLVDDLDNDGLDDIVVLYRSFIATWYKNNGSGNFTEVATIDPGTTIVSLSIVDWDGDGDKDFFMSDSSGKLSWYENINGLGAFPNQVLVYQGNTSYIDRIKNFRFNDFDLDGDQDLFALGESSQYDYQIVVFENTGSTILSDFTAISTENVTQFEFNDNNQDGLVDILFVGETQSFSNRNLFKVNQKQDNSFFEQEWIDYLSEDQTHIKTVDLYQDGNTDFLYIRNVNFSTLTPSTSKIMIINDISEKTEHSPINYFDYDLSGLVGQFQFDIGDLNGDGQEDIVVAAPQSNRLLWYQNLIGQPVFAEMKDLNIAVENNFNGQVLKIFDWDQDGNNDLLATSPTDLYLYTNNTSLNNGLLLLDSIDSNTIRIGDFDQDNDTDILAVDLKDLNFKVYYNDGNNNFNSALLLSNPSQLKRSFKIYPTDVGGDGDADIVVAWCYCVLGSSNDYNQLEYIENLGTSFASPQVISSSSSEIDFINFQNATDLAQNGEVNLILRNFGKIAQRIYSPTTQNLGFIQDLTQNLGNWSIYELTDVDQDGDIDIPFYSNGDFGWITSQNGNWSSITIKLSNIDVLRDAKFADMDGDGDKDILVYVDNYDYLRWYQNNNNQFDDEDNFFIGPYSSQIESKTYADPDLDGDIDILGYFEDQLIWKENYDGLGSYTTGRNIGDPILPFNFDKIFVTDIDSDNDLDIITPSTRRIYENNGVQSFTEIIMPSAKWGELMADMNNDGYQDLISSSNMSLFDPATNGFDQVTLNYTSNSDILGIIDINQDGLLDLFVGSDCYINSGGGNFSAPISLLSSSNITGLSIADIDNDNLDDAIVVGYGIIEWYKNITGPGMLAEPVFITTGNAFSSQEIIIQDTNGDGWNDFTYGNLWYKNIPGSPYFASPQVIYNDDPQSGLGGGVTASDVDGDGNTDIILQNGWIQLDYNADGTINTSNKPLISGSSEIVDKTLLDLDLDGDLDILVVKEECLFWYQNNSVQGAPKFDNQEPITKMFRSDGNKIFSANLHGDSAPELIEIGESYIGYRKLIAPKTFSPLFLVKDVNTSFNPDARVKVNDFTGDGLVDILRFDIFPQSGYGLELYHFETGILDIIQINMGGFFFHKYSNFLPLDIGGNGLIDIIFNEDDKIYWIENKGNGVYANPVVWHSTSNGWDIYEIALVDIDHDNNLDLIYTSGSNQVSSSSNFAATQKGGNHTSFLVKNVETAAPLSPVQILANLEYESLVFTDIDNDYLTDILVHQNESNQLDWIRQDSSGAFLSLASIPLALPSNFSLINDYNNNDILFNKGITLFDFDGDFDNDLLYSWGGYTKVLAMRENLTTQASIKGMCFFDENENGILDPQEKGLSSLALLLAPDALFTYSEQEGSFEYFVENGLHELSYVPDPWWELTTDSSIYSIIVDSLPIDSLHIFGFSPTIDTLGISPFVTSGITRCNMPASFVLHYENTGTRKVSGQYFFVKDSLAQLDTVDIAPSQIIGDTLIWDFVDLYPYSEFLVRMTFLMPDELSTGDYLKFEGYVEAPDTTDGSTYNNAYTYYSEVRCAYDPNDKLVQPNRTAIYNGENYTLFEEELYYTIRFQNVGNDTAFHITIIDQLDTNLDWETFHPLVASHPYELQLNDNGLLSLYFRNILLVDSTANEPASHGFFSYKIQTLPGLPEETEISNTASIYFDYNSPIITNTTNNILVSELPFVSNLNNPELPVSEIRVFPNPMSENKQYLTIETSWKNFKIQLLTIDGKQITSTSSSKSNIEFLFPSVSPGTYIMVLNNGNEQVVKKIIFLGN